MKVKYLAALAAVSVLSVGTLASCGPDTTEPDAMEEIAPEDGAMEEPVMEEGAMEEDGAMKEPADPCAAE